MPIYFGVWNVISLIIADYFGLSIRNRFVLISILSSTLTSIVVTVYKLYNFKTYEEYIGYYIRIFIIYMILWNIVIYNIEKNI